MSLAEQWASYEREVLPSDAPLVQRRECRRAFYAGAQAFLGSMLEVSDEPEDTGVDRIESLNLELQVFVAQVKARQA